MSFMSRPPAAPKLDILPPSLLPATDRRLPCYGCPLPSRESLLMNLMIIYISSSTTVHTGSKLDFGSVVLRGVVAFGRASSLPAVG
jgi:hypothetical protein